MKVLAAVVTHNRRDLLARCLDGLALQSRAADAVLVINNDSTDGTLDMLAERDVQVITQANLGSAGGWNRAIAEALVQGFDAIWLMDDDGFPDALALAELITAWTPETACLSSIVVREDAPDRFVFPFPKLDDAGLPVIFGWPRKLATISQLSALAPSGTYPFTHLFNGALISLAAVRQVGNVDPAFFMFGDEVDFFFRIRQAGRVCSVLKAKHYHPDVSQRAYSAAKVYYYVKNTLALNRRYFNAVWIRNGLSIGIVIVRVLRRNGLGEALSYLAGRKAPALWLAIRRGLNGEIGRDFDV